MEVLNRHDTSLDEEGRFRLLVDAITDYAIYMLSPEGIVTSCTGRCGCSRTRTGRRHMRDS